MTQTMTGIQTKLDGETVVLSGVPEGFAVEFLGAYFPSKTLYVLCKPAEKLPGIERLKLFIGRASSLKEISVREAGTTGAGERILRYTFEDKNDPYSLADLFEGSPPSHQVLTIPCVTAFQNDASEDIDYGIMRHPADRPKTVKRLNFKVE